MQIFKMAIKSIISNKGRTFLTMLGVIIGVGSVIAAVGFAQGSTSSITNSISSLGSNVITVTIRGRGSNISVSYDQLEQFVQENSNLISAIAPSATLSGMVKTGDQSRTTTVLGTTAEYASIESVTVQEGRFLSDLDTENNTKIAVVGTAVVNDIFDKADPIGKSIKIDGQLFKVVGVLTQTADGADNSTDDRVIIPYHLAELLSSGTTDTSTTTSTEGGSNQSGGSQSGSSQSGSRSGSGNSTGSTSYSGGSMQSTNYYASATSSSTVDQAVDALDNYLGQIFSNTSAFQVTDMSTILSTLTTVTSSLTVLLAGLAAISLVVGGIGIMNIMLVSVTERTREIGIRKAIGAKKHHILVQFLIESLLVTGTGGVIGILLGIGIIHFVIGGTGIVPVVYSIKWIIISFSFSLAMGLICGIYPANKAANLNPIDALASE